MGRPSTPLLTRDGILRAALDLVDEQGPDALTTNRLAARLGVRGPSLYHHIANRNEIIEGLRELIVAEMDATAASLRPWTLALDRWARSYRAAFAAHPRVIPLLTSTPVRAPAALAHYASAVTVLSEAGWPDHLVMPVIETVESFLLGSALALAAPDHPAETEDLPPELAAALAARPANPSDKAFEVGLAALIEGLEHHRRLLT